jgi:hypothetical protein
MRQLVPGDEFALRSDGLFCRHDHDALEGEKLCGGGVATTIAGNENNNNANLTNNNHHLHPNDGSLSGEYRYLLLLL